MEAQLAEKDQFAHDLVEGVRKERERLAGLQNQARRRGKMSKKLVKGL